MLPYFRVFNVLSLPSSISSRRGMGVAAFLSTGGGRCSAMPRRSDRMCSMVGASGGAARPGMSSLRLMSAAPSGFMGASCGYCLTSPWPETLPCASTTVLFLTGFTETVISAPNALARISSATRPRSDTSSLPRRSSSCSFCSSSVREAPRPKSRATRKVGGVFLRGGRGG